MKAFLLIAMLAGAVWFAVQNIPPSPASLERRQQDERRANFEAKAKREILSFLKSPGSAQFSDIQTVDTGHQVTVVKGAVDSQNGFGAMIRKDWTVTFDGEITAQVICGDIRYGSLETIQKRLATPTPKGSWMWEKSNRTMLDRPAYQQR